MLVSIINILKGFNISFLQDAIQAQMVIQKMSELGLSTSGSGANELSPSSASEYENTSATTVNKQDSKIWIMILSHFYSEWNEKRFPLFFQATASSSTEPLGVAADESSLHQQQPLYANVEETNVDNNFSDPSGNNNPAEGSSSTTANYTNVEVGGNGDADNNIYPVSFPLMDKSS